MNILCPFCKYQMTTITGIVYTCDQCNDVTKGIYTAYNIRLRTWLYNWNEYTESEFERFLKLKAFW
jgi:hypothetical protein